MADYIDESRYNVGDLLYFIESKRVYTLLSKTESHARLLRLGSYPNRVSFRFHDAGWKPHIKLGSGIAGIVNLVAYTEAHSKRKPV